MTKRAMPETTPAFSLVILCYRAEDNAKEFTARTLEVLDTAGIEDDELILVGNYVEGATDPTPDGLGRRLILSLYNQLFHLFFPACPLHADDLVPALIAALDRSVAAGRRYVLAGPEETTYLELVTRLLGRSKTAWNLNRSVS